MRRWKSSSLNNLVSFSTIPGTVLIRPGSAEEFLISFAVVKFSAGVKFSPHHLLAEYNEEELRIKELVDVFFLSQYE